MGKRRYTIRLYRLHDLDLITFIETHEFNIVKAIYSSLSAFSKDDLFVIDIPARRIQDLPQLRRVYVKALSLDEEKDKRAIEILEKIEKGYRNNFLKNLLRQYLCNPMSEEFLIDQDDAEYFYKKFSIFREGKRVAKAGRLKKNNIDRKKDKESELNSDSRNKNNKTKNKEFEKQQVKNIEIIKYEDDTINESVNENLVAVEDIEEEDITSMFAQIIE